MMGWREQAWIRRTLFVAGNLAAVAAIGGLVVWPLCDVFAARDAHIAEQRAVLARLDGIIAQEARIQAVGRDTDAQVQGAEFLHGPNDGVISAEMQTRLKAFTESSGARLRSVQALPPANREQLRHIGVRLEISGPIAAVQRVVHAVETAKPYLFVSAASLKLAPTTVRPGSAEPVIDAQLDIVGAVHSESRDK
jgi:general secretion pathway protein M